MKYYILNSSDPGWHNRPLYAKIDSRVDFALSRALWDATPLSFSPTVSFSVPKSAPLPDFLSTGTTLWLFSQKFLNLLKKMKVKFESFPIILHDRKGNQLSRGFELFHLLQVRSIVDRNLSVIPNLTQIEKIVLSNMTTEPEDSMIRDTYMLSKVFVREDLYEVINDAGITGCYWIEPEKYRFILRRRMLSENS